MDAGLIVHSLFGFFALHALAPERHDEIVALGGKTIVSGTLATCVAGSVVGILY